MKSEAIIIGRTAIDFSTFLGIALKVLGHSPAASADASGRHLTDASRFISCLATIRDEKAKITTDPNPKLLPHVSYSVLLIVDAADSLEILECATEMPFVATETMVRNVWMLIITGTLSQWKNAVRSGSSCEVETSVRYTFNKIQGLFQEEGVNLWTEYRQRPSPDQITYLLEDKRGR